MWRYFIFAGLVSAAAANAEPLQQDNRHIRIWNQFAQNLLKLHRQRIRQQNVSKKTRSGGYAQMPDFYLEESFYIGDRLISKVQWEKQNPQQLHTIEVYLHDSQGRVVRDYAAAYLPVYHNAPTQTLITLHRYNKGLHAFRSFDASGYRIVERCTGRLNGREVNLLLDEDEIDAALGDPRGVMATQEYRQCFGDLPQKAGKYLNPQ